MPTDIEIAPTDEDITLVITHKVIQVKCEKNTYFYPPETLTDNCNA